MPANKVRFYNKIDMGIFLFLLEACLRHHGFSFTAVQYTEVAAADEERLLAAKYTIFTK